MEEEALRNHCGRMIRHLVRNKQQQLQCVSGRRAGGRQQSSQCERRVEPGDESRDDGTSLHITGQGPSVQPVPPQLISMLRLRTFNEEMRRAAEAELHDPAVCAACEQERASLALKRFIRRKTQLQFQTLRKTQHTHNSYGKSAR